MSINSDLRKLRMKKLSRDDQDDFLKQINSIDNDRGAAILASTLLETGLRSALAARICIHSADRIAIFDNNGPLSTLDSCIILARALHIVGEKTYHNLNTIKHIRNTFAHAAAPVSFSNPEIIKACDTLLVTKKYRDASHKYIQICYETGLELLNYAQGCDLEFVKNIADPSILALTWPTSLP
jgi:DNA-binding MltR family transcriptional regulator